MALALNVGIDPAQKQCVARAVDQSGQVRGRPIWFAPDRPGVSKLEEDVRCILPGAEVHYFIEASGYLWYPVAVGLERLGQTVSLVNPTRVAAQRKVSSPKVKGDVADAEAAARVAFSIGDKARHPADIPDGVRLTLQRLCRYRHRLQQDATAIKLRLLAWLSLTSPGLSTIIGSDLSDADRELIKRFPVIADVVDTDPEAVQAVLQSKTGEPLDDAAVDRIYELARAAVCPQGLDRRLMKMQFSMELERLAGIEKAIAKLDKEIRKLLPELDTDGLAKTIPGFGDVVAPIMVAEAGIDVSRFADASKFAGWTGVVGKASGSAGKQTEGLPITKAGRSIVKWALHMAARSAINHDPECREFYERLRAKGKHHNKALTAVAHKIARIYYAVMFEHRPFQTRPATPSSPVEIPADNVLIT